MGFFALSALHLHVDLSFVDELALALEEEVALELEGFGHGVVVDAEHHAFARHFVLAQRFTLLHAKGLGVARQTLQYVVAPVVVVGNVGVELPEGAAVEDRDGSQPPRQVGMLLHETHCPVVHALHAPLFVTPLGIGLCDAVGHHEVLARPAPIVVLVLNHLRHPAEVPAYLAIYRHAFRQVPVEEVAVFAPDVHVVEARADVAAGILVLHHGAAREKRPVAQPEALGHRGFKPLQLALCHAAQPRETRAALLQMLHALLHGTSCGTLHHAELYGYARQEVAYNHRGAVLLDADGDVRVGLEAPHVVAQLVGVVVEDELPGDHAVEEVLAALAVGGAHGPLAAARARHVDLGEELAIHGVEIKGVLVAVLVNGEIALQVLAGKLGLPPHQGVELEDASERRASAQPYHAHAPMLAEEPHHALGLVFLALGNKGSNLFGVGIQLIFSYLKLVVGGKELFVDGCLVEAVDHWFANLKGPFGHHAAESVHHGLHQEVGALYGLHLSNAHYLGAIFFLHVLAGREHTFLCLVHR